MMCHHMLMCGLNFSHVQGDVDKLLAKYLNKREREIVRLHYGLDHPDGRGLSLDKISYR